MLDGFFLQGVVDQANRKRALDVQQRSVDIQDRSISQREAEQKALLRKQLGDTLAAEREELFGALDNVIQASTKNGLQLDQLISGVSPIAQQIIEHSTIARKHGFDFNPDKDRLLIESRLASFQTPEQSAQQQQQAALQEGQNRVIEARGIAQASGQPLNDVLISQGLASKPKAPDVVNFVHKDGQSVAVDLNSAGANIRVAQLISQGAVRGDSGRASLKFFRNKDGSISQVDLSQRDAAQQSQSLLDADAVPLEGGVNVTSQLDLSPASVNTVQKNLLASEAGLQRLNAIKASFDDKFLQIGPRIKNTIAALKGKVSLSLLSDDERNNLSDFADFYQKTFDNVNLYIKEITGAQMSLQEAQRIRRAIPDPGDNVLDFLIGRGQDPVSFMANLNSAIEQLTLVRSRAFMALKHGIISENHVEPESGGPLESISLESVRASFNERHAALLKEMTALGVKNPEQRAMELTKKEFGI